ncbi:MAG: response regulator [Candidatus Rokubacteria bacterium]|nr:response regulator [Candidatus Rokubacteria bacterium]
MLSAADFEVWEAVTGEEGAQRAAALPDLVLCDVQLPDIDGFEVCRRLREDPVTASLPIFFMSGIYRDAKDRVRGLREGADGFLVRPRDVRRARQHRPPAPAAARPRGRRPRRGRARRGRTPDRAPVDGARRAAPDPRDDSRALRRAARRSVRAWRRRRAEAGRARG